MSQAGSARVADEVDYELVFVEEFDALSIDVKLIKMPGEPGAPGEPEEEAFEEVSSEEPLAKAKYPAKDHARKVARELSVKEGLIYLPGLPTPLYEDSDMGPQFRQRRYFYYLGGADFEDCAVTYDIGNDELILWVPYIDPRQVLWYGTGPSPDACKAKTQLDDVRYTDDLGSYLRKRFGLDAASSSSSSSSSSDRSDIQRVGATIGSSFCNDRRLGLAKALSSKPPTLYVLHANQLPELFTASALKTITVDKHSLQPAMDHARVTKTPYEIAMIRKANDISSSAHRVVLQQLRQMTNERNIEAAFAGHCLDVYGAKHQSYPVIAGSGANAGVLHYFANDQPLAGRQVVCLDAGAEWELYASDVTRSFPISGTFSPEAGAIYAIVERMQNEVFARFKPGVPFRYLHLHAASVAADGLLRLGILKGASAGKLLGLGTIAAFFPHGLGHHVGLEVHDVLSPDLMAATAATVDDDADAASVSASRPGGSKRMPATPAWYAAVTAEAMAVSNGDRSRLQSLGDRRRLLEPGMIITVEPGIYFCRPYIESFFLQNPLHAQYIDQAVLEKYYAVGGIRIEDCLLVTETGHENLTTAPKGEEALKIIRGII